MKNKKTKKNVNLKKVFILLLVLAILIFCIYKICTNKNNTETVETSSSNTKDTIAPEIKLNGNEESFVILGKEYKEEGATATDNLEGDISSKIEITGEVNTSEKGNYELTYSVKDSSGNTSEVKRKVAVCDSIGKKGLPILMYHFFYDKNKGTGKDNNWIEISDFEKQVKYLADNSYYFPTWEEVENYIDGKTDLPEKSIVVTVDDADPSYFELAVPVLEKYNVHSTSFVITAWYGYRAGEKYNTVVYHSHSNDMHEPGAGGKGRMVTWSYDKVVQDLKTSSEILGGSDVFCYPFGHYNDTAIKALKNTGFKLAVTTEEGRVYKGANKYKLPRVRISRNTGFEDFKSKIK